MIWSVLNVTAVQTMEFETFGAILERRGNQGIPGVRQDIYRCAGDESWIAVTVRTDGEWEALVALMGIRISIPRGGSPRRMPPQSSTAWRRPESPRPW